MTAPIPCTSRPALAFLLALCAGAAISLAAPPSLSTSDAADRVTPAPIKPTPAPVEALLSASYLTPEQRADARVRFGRYTPDDLTSPARAARAALLRGVLNDPSLAPDIADADPLDRAEAAALRGDFAAAMKLLDAAPASPRAARIRAAALEDQGKFDEAMEVAKPVLAELAARKLTAPDDIVEAVSLAAMRLRILGPASIKNGAAANDYKSLLTQLDTILNTTDRLSWPAMLAQAELLAARDNKQEAAEALMKAIDLNPACARGWAMMGRLMVEGFQFELAEKMAKRLDILASDWPGPEGGDPDPLPSDLEAGDPGAFSPEAASVIARLLLRQSEGARALAILAPQIEKYPHAPRLLALKCAALAVSFDFKTADESLAAFDRVVGPSPLAHYEVGRALSDARQYAQSETHLREAARRQPNLPEPHIELGLMLMQAGKDADALKALERAFALDPFNARADNSLRLARELQSYEKIETPHYIIRCKPGPNTDGGPSDTILARDMAAPLERNYAIVTGKEAGGIDFEPAQKTLIDLMPDHRWFGVRIAGMPAIHTIAASTGPIIAMESPRDGANHLGTYDWVRVLRHEFTHTVNLGRTNNRIPHWFTEASAVYLEQAPRDWQTCQLLAAAYRQKKLFDFDQINLAFVRPKKATDRSQAYAQGHWMYEYIIQRAGPRAPLDLMDKYAAGVREEEAFQSVLGISRAKFMTEFMAWARQQLVDWGMEPPAGTPTLRQLLAREALAALNAAPAPVPSDPNESKPLDEAGKFTAAQGKLALQRIIDGKPTETDDDVDLPEPTTAWIAKWLAEFPHHPDVLELAMNAAVESHDGKATPEIEPLISRYAAARPVDPKPHRLLARMYLDMPMAAPAPSPSAPSPAPAGKVPSDAKAEGARATPDSPTSPALRVIEHLEYLDQREQKVPTYAMELARRYAALGNFEKAAAAAERATQIDPFNAPTRELAATIALQARDPRTAQRHIEALTQLEPTRDIHKQRLEAVRKMLEQAPR